MKGGEMEILIVILVAIGLVVQIRDFIDIYKHGYSYPKYEKDKNEIEKFEDWRLR